MAISLAVYLIYKTSKVSSIHQLPVWMNVYAFVMVGKCELVPFISFLNTIYVNHSSICLTMIAFVFRKKKAVT